jgi:hypothetical protein
MAIARTVDLPRIERVLGRFVETTFAGSVGVRWQDQNHPRPPLPFVGFKLISPPTRLGLASRVRQRVPRTVRVTVAGVGVGSTERMLVVNGLHVAATAATDDAMRDALVAAVNDSEEHVTASDGPLSTQLDITGDTVGDLRTIRGIGGLTIANLVEEDVVYQTQRKRALLSVNCHSRAAVGEASADAILQALQHALEDTDRLPTLREHGIGVLTISPARDLSQLENTEQESRVQCDVALLVSSRTARLLERIEVVQIDRLVGDNAGTITIDSTP